MTDFILCSQNAVQKSETELESRLEKLSSDRTRVDTRCQELEQQLCGTQHREGKLKQECEALREQSIKMNGQLELQKAEYQQLVEQVNSFSRKQDPDFLSMQPVIKYKDKRWQNFKVPVLVLFHICA